MKLPQSVKHLLTLKGPAPSSNPTAERLHRAFDATRKQALEQNALKGWLVLSTSTLLGCNSPAAIGHLYRYVNAQGNHSQNSNASRVETAEVMREAALKGSIFVGVAMTINAMAELMAAVEPGVKEQLRTVPVRNLDTSNVSSVMARGSALWNSIYQPHADKLQRKLGSYHPDFPLFILQAYGNVLSPSSATGVGHLNRVETSLVGIATLRAMRGVGPQLTSHVYGLMKAGGSDAQSAADQWLASENGATWALETVDAISDVALEAADEVRSKL